MLTFKVEPRYLIHHTLVQCSRRSFVRHNRFLIDFQNLAYNLDKQAYSFLQHRPSIDCLLSGALVQMATRAEKLIEVLLEEKMFEQILNETTESVNKIAAEWHADEKLTATIVQELTGLEMRQHFEVLVTHPDQRNGACAGEKLLWAYRDDFPHYNSVYLWHEVLHFYLGSSDVAHAVIELLADNELRVRLNGGTYPPFEGHDYLGRFREALLPHWVAYLSSSNKEIHRFISKHESLLDREC